MLVWLYVALRFVHFATLFGALGCALYCAWWAPPALRRLLSRRLLPPTRLALLLCALAASLTLPAQGGLMGDGWTDAVTPSVWLAVAGTHAGAVAVWQLLLAWVTLAVIGVRPRRTMALVLIFVAAQCFLLAGSGHAAMRDGAAGALQRLNHALHLLCASSWVGGLPPFLYCLRLARGRWRPAAISAMMRFSRYGHFAVAGTILTGAANLWLIHGAPVGDSPWVRMALLKCGLVALMVIIALANRYLLAPRMTQGTDRAQRLLLRTTQAELLLAALALALVSLFATWEPY